MTGNLPTEFNGKSITVAMTGWSYAYGLRDEFFADFASNTIDAPVNLPKGSVCCSSVRASQWQTASIANSDRF